MARNKGKSKEWLNIAKERIQILFEQAELNPKRADRYVFLARKISMRYNIRIPLELRRKFCRKCNHYFIHKGDVIVRTNPKTRAVEYSCKSCGGVTRYGYNKEAKKRNG